MQYNERLLVSHNELQNCNAIITRIVQHTLTFLFPKGHFAKRHFEELGMYHVSILMFFNSSLVYFESLGKSARRHIELAAIAWLSMLDCSIAVLSCKLTAEIIPGGCPAPEGLKESHVGVFSTSTTCVSESRVVCTSFG